MKTAELTGAALDWAVAKCEGNTFAGDYPHLLSAGFRPPKYSTDWSQGGPIIEREGIGFSRNGIRTFSNDQMRYEARVTRNQDDAPICRVGYRGTGPTPLIAAMRCYVASKLGDNIDVPEELT